MWEQPEAPHVGKGGALVGGQEIAGDAKNLGVEEAATEKAPIFSVKMQTFDKTFQDCFNTYLKIGEQAVSVNDVSMKQNETYVDHGQFGSLYQRNFRAGGASPSGGVRPPLSRQHLEAR